VIQRGDNYVFAARNDRLEAVIRKRGHAWRDTLGFLTDVAAWTMPGRPRALNRYFIWFELAERFGVPAGRKPGNLVNLEIRAKRPMTFDVQGRRLRGRVIRTTIDAGLAQTTPIRGRGDYAAVRIRPGRSLRDTVPRATFGLEYEAGAAQPTEVELSFTFPSGYRPADMKWGKLWERTLDEASLIHNPDGTLTVRHVLHPGRRAYRAVAAAGFPVRETFPLTKRNVFFEFARIF
jgi:hypothetical protein